MLGKKLKLITENYSDVSTGTENGEDGKSYYLQGIYAQAELKNKNGRIYPLDYLKESIDYYRENFIKLDKSYMECDHPCFSKSANILTVNGWKSIVDVEVGELVYTLDPDTLETVIKPVREKVVKPFKGKMIRLKNRTLNTLVTPDHRFPTHDATHKLKYRTAGEIKELLDSNSLRNWLIPKASKSQNTSPARIKIGNLDLDFTNFVRFLGIYLAEGCVVKQKKSDNCLRAMVSQVKPQGILDVEKIFEQLDSDIKFSRYSDPKKRHIWYTQNKDLTKYLHALGKQNTRYIPKDIINLLDDHTAGEFIDAFMLGDGRGTRHKARCRCDMFTTSKQLANDLSQVVFLAGYGSRQFTLENPPDAKMGDRIITNKSPLHFIVIMKGQGVYIDKRHLSATEEEFDDLVYCINIDNTSFYASDNEYSFWSGNCYPEVRLSNCCARIISLEQSGNDWLGKSIVFNGGKGEIIKTIIDSKSRLSVSTRALGEVVKTESTEYVKRGMVLTAIDVVADASAPNAFVRGILEGRDFSYIPMDGNVIDSINNKYKADVKEGRQRRFDKGSERILIEQLEHLIKRKLKAL